MTIDRDMVVELTIKYFDTVPVATAMSLLKSGLLFVASEFGNQYLFTFVHLGDADQEPSFSSASPVDQVCLRES